MSIIHEINECSCPKCQAMCRTPCIGTPDDMVKIAKAGFSDRLSVSGWAVGVLAGTHDSVVSIIAPTYDEEKKSCTFFSNGLCELHDLGLKPTEGRYATCKPTVVNTREEMFNTPLYKCISEWEKFKKFQDEYK